MKPDRTQPDTDLERGFEPLRTLFAAFTLLLGFLAAVQAEPGTGPREARARDGHPPQSQRLDAALPSPTTHLSPAPENSHAH